MRAISIERARRTVMEATTSPRASFSFTLLRTISRGDADMAFLRGDCPLLYARADFPPVGNRQDRALRPDPGVHAEGRLALPRTAAHRLRDHRNRCCAGDHGRVEDALGGGPAVPVDDSRYLGVSQPRRRPGTDGSLHEERRHLGWPAPALRL